jgi:hypothetical protein
MAWRALGGLTGGRLNIGFGSGTSCPISYAKIGASMPGFGEPWVNSAEVFTYCHVQVVDLCPSTELRRCCTVLGRRGLLIPTSPRPGRSTQ